MHYFAGILNFLWSVDPSFEQRMKISDQNVLLNHILGYFPTDRFFVVFVNAKCQFRLLEKDQHRLKNAEFYTDFKSEEKIEL